MTRLDRTNAPHYVYRCFDIDGRLIYVGSSANLFGRLEQHRHTSWWAPTVANVKAIYFPNGVLARAVERRAIREEVPRWNKAGKWVSRHLWTRNDWHDWITVLLRGQTSSGMQWMTAELERSIADYVALFGEQLPDDLSDQILRVRELTREKELALKKAQAEQRIAFELREAAEEKAYNDELAAKRRKKKGKSA